MSDDAKKVPPPGPCTCETPRHYTGMSPLASRLVVVAFRCESCGAVWGEKMSIDDANRVRVENSIPPASMPVIEGEKS